MRDSIERSMTIRAPVERVWTAITDREQLEVEATADGAGATFRALADPTRRLLLQRLSAEGEASAGHLAAGLPMSRQAVAKHLAALEEAGLVHGERVGREVRYRLRPEPLAEAERWIDAVAAAWDHRLASLRALVEAGGR